MKPNRCIVFGVDSGKRSGWSILKVEEYIASGVARRHLERKAAFERAVEAARESGLPLIVGREEWTPGWEQGKRTFKSIVGTGASWGRWEPVFEEAGFPVRRIFAVDPTKWRKMVLSLKPGTYNREQGKHTAIVYCRARQWYEGEPEEITHDQAEASCIAFFMIYDKRVAEAIRNPGRLKKL